MRVSVYGVNVAASNGRPRPAFPDTPIMPRCELTRRIADGGGTKVKSPQGKPLTINTSILGSLASPASPLSTPNDRKCPFDGAQCQMDGICFLNTQRALLGDERLPQASAIQAEARSAPRNNIATRIEFEFVETRPVVSASVKSSSSISPSFVFFIAWIYPEYILHSCVFFIFKDSKSNIIKHNRF